MGLIERAFYVTSKFAFLAVGTAQIAQGNVGDGATVFVWSTVFFGTGGLANARRD